MGGVLEALYELLLRAGRVDSTAVKPYILVFGGGCFVIALLVLVLDICVFVVRGRSFLGYRHGFKRSILAAMLIPTAAGIVGMIGLGVDVIQPSRASCVTVGVAWQTLMTVLMGLPGADGEEPDEDDEPATGVELV